MHIHNPKRGIALLVSLIFMSVMLALGLTLASLGYKQSVLASNATQSQYAFYAADAALECALYADQQQQAFIYTAHDAVNKPNPTICDGIAATEISYTYSTGPTGRLAYVERMSLDNTTRCADVTIYKLSDGRSFLFAQGYDVSCAVVATPNGARISSRGLDARY